ncbi:hypothetical protein KY290_009942 [Solanum tuberosum]|uniref:Uncharacterized protein n=1 Tax=Solanum tuberosum TaxID=4113 RepID=A0ABQ7VWZ7_SOLTU|nr:hypothetical protein KY284_009896 [Solanum tuberosum]KAH0772805.1 hypothetical protein KY290_009942 [Solanum tuberosum]
MEKLKKFDVKYCRYVYCNDMVPRLPYDDKTLFFKHFGSCLFYNSLYCGKVLEEEPNKNYFSLLWVLPKVLNAVFELIRSFILPWIKGNDYKQSWSEIIFRMVGLIIPGLSAHGPVDYVNLTRLGTNLHLPESQEVYRRRPQQRRTPCAPEKGALNMSRKNLAICIIQVEHLYYSS